MADMESNRLATTKEPAPCYECNSLRSEVTEYRIVEIFVSDLNCVLIVNKRNVDV